MKVDVGILKTQVSTLTQLCDKLDKVIERLMDNQDRMVNQIYDDMDRRKQDTVADIKDAIFKKRSAMLLGAEMERMYRSFGVAGEPKKITLSEIVGDK